MESINEKIKRLRIESGVSKAEMARAAGLKQSSYSSIENGETKSITIEVGKGITKALNIPFTELFEIESSNGNAEIIEKLKAEVERLNKQIEEKTLTIEALKNEKAHVKEHLVLQLVTNASYDLGWVNQQISKEDDEIEKKILIRKKEDILKTFARNKEYYYKTGFFVPSDITKLIEELEGAIEKELILRHNDLNN